MRPTLVLTALSTLVLVTQASELHGLLGFLPAPASDADFAHAEEHSAAKIELGRLLFFDKILSGNKNISCATCHHPTLGSGDGLALPLGEGPRGLGPDRRPGRSLEESIFERVPRNSPPLFNLGAKEFTRLFHDGRVEADPEGFYEGGFVTPAKWKLPTGLESVLAAQAMFPVTSATEMAGQKGENPVADAASVGNAAGPGGVWELLATRLAEIPAYARHFQAAFPAEIRGAEDITFVHAANAIAAFEAVAFRADDSPFDRYLEGDAPLSPAAQRGMELFYGVADCSSCHSGTYQTDHDFHAIAMPQIGPGKSDGWDASYWQSTGIKAFPEDHGRGRVTVREEDQHRFRTPSLRNVELTGPWGHAGTFATLESTVRHHLDPIGSLEAYRLQEGHLTEMGEVLQLSATNSRLDVKPMDEDRRARYMERDSWVMSREDLRESIAEANELEAQVLSEDEVSDLVAFLRSLTDPSSRNLEWWIPLGVPSGLSVDD